MDIHQVFRQFLRDRLLDESLDFEALTNPFPNILSLRPDEFVDLRVVSSALRLLVECVELLLIVAHQLTASASPVLQHLHLLRPSL